MSSPCEWTTHTIYTPQYIASRCGLLTTSMDPLTFTPIYDCMWTTHIHTNTVDYSHSHQHLLRTEAVYIFNYLLYGHVKYMLYVHVKYTSMDLLTFTPIYDCMWTTHIHTSMNVRETSCAQTRCIYLITRGLSCSCAQTRATQKQEVSLAFAHRSGVYI